jgi:hypothetical protein
MKKPAGYYLPGRLFYTISANHTFQTCNSSYSRRTSS